MTAEKADRQRGAEATGAHCGGAGRIAEQRRRAARSRGAGLMAGYGAGGPLRRRHQPHAPVRVPEPARSRLIYRRGAPSRRPLAGAAVARIGQRHATADGARGTEAARALELPGAARPCRRRTAGRVAVRIRGEPGTHKPRPSTHAGFHGPVCRAQVVPACPHIGRRRRIAFAADSGLHGQRRFGARPAICRQSASTQGGGHPRPGVGRGTTRNS